MNNKYNFSFKRIAVALFACMLFVLGSAPESKAQLITIGTGTFSATSSGPYYAFYNSHKAEWIYTGAQLLAAGATPGNTPTSVAWYLNTNSWAAGKTMPNWTIKMAWTTQASLVAAYAGPAPTTVYTTTLTNGGVANAWNTYSMSAFLAVWNGTDNLYISVCNDFITGGYFTPYPTVRYTSSTPTTMCRLSYNDLVLQCPVAPNLTSLNRPNIQLNFGSIANCAGTPNAGTATGPTGACTGSFTVSSSGLSTGTGISYQWQSVAGNCPGAGWANIGGAIAASYSTTQAVATSYRLMTTCSFSGLTNITSCAYVPMNASYNCTCASAATTVADEEIFNVTVTGVTTLNQSSTCATTGTGAGSVLNMYSNYKSGAGAPVAPQLGQATSASFSVWVNTCGTFNYNSGLAIFIDGNQDGDFLDLGEKVWNNGALANITCVPATVVSNSFLVPAGFTTGLTAMRVIDAEGFAGTTITPCLSYGYGETEDYLVNIVPTPPCVGTPAAGTATGTPALACNATLISLNATGLTSAPGITYQWQANNASLGGWTNLPAGGITVSSGSVTSASVVVTTQTITTQYRVYSYCTNSSLDNNSNAVTATQDLPGNCYCIPSYTIGNVNGGGDYLNQIQDFAGYAGPVTGANPPNAAPWWYYTASSIASIDKGSSYNITLNNNPVYSEYFRVWIDYNQDGDFYDAFECITDAQYPAGAWNIAGNATGSCSFTTATDVQVPGMPATFTARIRFRCTYATTNQDPCLTYAYGETEDYLVTITTLPDCAGVPTGGTTNSSDPSPCSGIPLTLSASGSTTGVGGLIYQWQQSTVGCAGPWTNLGTGANQSYTFAGANTRYFRRMVKCNLSNLPYGDSAYSTCLSLISTLCYCTPGHTTGTSGGIYIDSFTVEGSGIAKQTGPNAVAPYYADYTAASGGSGTMMQGAPYWGVVKSGPGAGVRTVRIWCDWNGDGDFTDLGEGWNTGIYSNSGGFTYHFIQVPITATVGATRLRVRVSNVNAVLDPCLNTAPNYVQGESEDYLVNVTANACVLNSQAINITGILPTVTVANDFIDVQYIPGIGAITGWQIDWTAPYNFTPADATIASYTGDFIANVNPVPSGQGFVYIRANVQNGGCPVDISNAALVKLDCASSCSYNTSDNDDIARVVLGAGGSLFDNNQGVWPATHDASTDGYQNYLSMVGSPFHVNRATPIPFQVGVSATYGEGVVVWIDENGDGEFATTEKVYGDAATAGLHALGSVTIPCGSGYVGPAKMRVMNTYNVTYTAGATPFDPCGGPIAGARTWGEIEEYMLYIDDVADITVNPTSAVCLGQTQTLNATGPAGTTGFAWSPSNGVSGVIMNPANGTAASITVSTTTPSDVFFTVTGTLANGCTSYNIVPVATTPLAGVVSPAGSVICSGAVKLLTAVGAAGNYQWQSSLDNIAWSDIAGATNGLSYTTAAAIVNKYYRLLSKSAICYDISSNTAFVEIATTPVVTFTNVTATSATVNWSPVGGGSYNFSWTGAGTGNAANATPPYNLSGLTPNTNLFVTVTLTNPAACSPTIGAGTANTKTLCAAPLAPSFGAITTTTVVVNIPVGATSYKVFYKLMTISNTYLSSGVLAGGSSYTILSSIGTALYPGVALSVYLQAFNCPTVGLSGQAGPAVIQYLLPGTSSCPTPAFTLLSDCSNRIKVTLSGNPTNAYRVTFRRLSPSVNAPNSYNFTGTTLNYSVLNTPLPQIWEVYAQSTCGSAYGLPRSTMTQIQQILVKSGCNKINNLVLSHVTCNGFTATWNVGDCGIAPGLTGYTVFTKEGASQWNGYSSLTNVRTGSFWNSGATILCYVRANSCNGSFGPASDIQTITLLSGPGCREEDQQTEENLFGKGVTNEFGTLSLFPNPNSGLFNMDLQISNMTAQDVRVEVVNMLGQAVLTQITSINDGHLTESVDLPENITSGSYMVRVIVGDKAIFNSQVNISK